MFISLIFKQLISRRGDVWLLSAKWAAPIFSLIGGVIAARFLAPEEYGVVQAVLLIPAYAGFLHLGVFNGLNRNLPLFKAKGEIEKAQGFVNASARTARWVAVAGCIVALGAILSFLCRANNPLYAYVALFLVPCLALAPLKLHWDTLYRGTRNFERLGKALHLQNVWVFLCSVSTSFLGITGLALKIATQNLFGWLILRRNPPMEHQKAASLQDVRYLSAVGMPMLISGMLFTWLAAADRTVIATFLTAEDLGYFALATIAMSALQVFPASINQLLYPRVAQAYGQKGSSKFLRRYIWIGLAINLSLMIPIVIVGWFALPVIVEFFLPAYAPGIPSAKVALIGSLFFAYSGPSVIIPILRRNLPSQIAAVIAIGFVWAGGLYAISAGYGIVGVAVVRVIATAFYGLFVVGFVLYLTSRDIKCE